MAYRVSFMDNQSVESFDLNGITEELGGGALSFTNNTPYGVDSLNDISKTLITKGASCGCELSVTGNRVFVSEGVLFMPDGRRVEIDTEGISLEFVPGMVHYIYFFYEPTHGIVIPRCTTEAPSGAYVLLGRVSAEGVIEGRPERAVMKNPYLGLHGTESFTESFSWDGTIEEKLLWEYEMQDAGYQMLTVYSAGNSRETDGDKYIADDLCGFVKFSDGTAFSMTRKTDEQANGCSGEVRSYTSNNGEMYWGRVKGYNGKYYHHIYLRFELGTDRLLRVYQRAVKGGYIISPSNDTKAVEVTMTLS